MRATSDARPGRRLVALDLDAGRRHDLLDDVGVADLLARFRRAVVDALVADQFLQQLDGCGGRDRVDRGSHR